MAIEGTDTLDPNAEDPEYRKPNPQDNPRNISLGEIAQKVAGIHAEEDKETFPSIDDEGNITPPEAGPPPSEPALEAAATEVPPVPAEPAAATPADPQAVDPSKEYEVVVDGQKMKVKGSAIIDAGYRTFQKETAADFRLKMASELLQEAERKVAGAVPAGRPAPEAAPAEKTDAELANAMQYGTPEQSAEAVKVLRGRGISPEQVGRLVQEQARFAAQDELKFQDAMKFVEAEYGDLLKNDYVKRLFFIEENRRRAPRERGGEADSRPYKDLYQAIGDDLRKSLNLPKPASSTGAPIPGTAAVRQARKAETSPVPRTAATRLSEAAAAEKAKAPSEIIAGMAAARGKAQLRTQLKG